MPEVGCNNTTSMFFLQVFGHFDFLLHVLGLILVFYLDAIPKTVELGWEASLEMGGCSILLDGIPSSSSRCPRENGTCPAP